MSKSKTVTTLQDLKEKDDEKLIISSSKYKNIMKTLLQTEQLLTEAEENTDMRDIEIIHLKNKCLKLYDLAKQYKSELTDKNAVDKANKKHLKDMEGNAEKLQEEINNKSVSKYTKKSKEELERMVLERMADFDKQIDIDNLM